ncbi:DExH-box ATP-dependent RNA helicase DExH14 [Tanacetum coccineum]
MCKSSLAEAFYTISFKNLALPESHTTHTELLDLKPLPVTALGNKAYEELYRFSHFNPIQTQAFHILYHKQNNILLGAPTGSGKTISAEQAMLQLFNTAPDMKVIYIAPLKAIVREKMNDWKNGFVSKLGKKCYEIWCNGSINKKLFSVELTGDYTPDLMALMSADIIISTPEKWDGISRNWHSRSYVTKVGLMILDEIHLLGANRGPILKFNGLYLLYTLEEIYVCKCELRVMYYPAYISFGIIALLISNWLPGHRLEDEIHIIKNGAANSGYPGKLYSPRMNSMNKPTYAAICTHSPTKPVLIFVSSRRQTRLTALDLIQFAAADEHPVQFLAVPKEALQMVLSQVTDQNLRHTLEFGIGLHHAGLNDKDRSLVEELFANNKNQVLVCTSTLAWGVNLPAHLVIIKGTEYYDAKAKRDVDFPITDILQMMGRAGRPQYDKHAKAVILVHEPKKALLRRSINQYKIINFIPAAKNGFVWFLYEPFPVESSLKDQLHDHINAEIVSGTISHNQDAVHYLSWTVNPAYYGLKERDPESLSSFLSSLVQNTFEDLEDGGCIQMNEDNVESSMLGKVASQYYLKYMTVSMFASNIGPDTSLEASDSCSTRDFLSVLFL